MRKLDCFPAPFGGPVGSPPVSSSPSALSSSGAVSPIYLSFLSMFESTWSVLVRVCSSPYSVFCSIDNLVLTCARLPLALTHPIGQKIVSIDDNLRPTIDLFTLSGARLATIQVTNPVCIFRRREVEVVSPTQHSSCQASEYHGQIVGMGWNDIEHLVVILEYAAINQGHAHLAHPYHIGPESCLFMALKEIFFASLISKVIAKSPVFSRLRSERLSFQKSPSSFVDIICAGMGWRVGRAYKESASLRAPRFR